MNKEQTNFNNLLLKVVEPGLMTIDTDELAAKAKERRAFMDAANPKEENWQQELSDLETRCKGHVSVETAKRDADNITREHDVVVKGVEKQIKLLQESLLTPYLDTHPRFDATRGPLVNSKGSKCGCDGCTFLWRIEKLQGSLPELTRLRQRHINLSGARMRSAQEIEKLQPRLTELRERDRAISRANYDPAKASSDAWIGPRHKQGGIDF
jgi:hypothetical protein